MTTNGRREREVVQLISLFYLAMSLIGLGLVGWRVEDIHSRGLVFPGQDWLAALVLTAGLVIGIHLLSLVAHAKFSSLRTGARDIQRFLGKLTPTQIAVVALMSGIGEELLFRAWLMNDAGLWISSLIFGLVHFPPNRKWIYWPFFAFLMGLLLGWLYLWSGSLLYPILLHAGVNFFNLKMLIKPQRGAE